MQFARTHIWSGCCELVKRLFFLGANIYHEIMREAARNVESQIEMRRNAQMRTDVNGRFLGLLQVDGVERAVFRGPKGGVFYRSENNNQIVYLNAQDRALFN
jgi:hypothetical protein